MKFYASDGHGQCSGHALLSKGLQPGRGAGTARHCAALSVVCWVVWASADDSSYMGVTGEESSRPCPEKVT